MQVDPVRAFVVVALAAVVVSLALPHEDDEKLIELLGAPAAAERDGAAREILSIGATIRPALLRARRSGSAAVRTRAGALLTLVEKGPPDPADYEAAAGRLAHAARAAASRGFVAPELVQALGEHPTQATVAALTDLVRDDRVLPSSGVAAARALELHAREELPRLAAFLPALDAALDTQTGPQRRAAAALLGALARDTAESVHLTRRAADPYPGVRAEIARALGRNRFATAAPLLARLAADDDALVRESALLALAGLPGAPHPEPAHRAAEDSDARVRAAAADLLARDAVPASRAVLALLADDPSPRVRVRAAEAQRRLLRPR